MEPERDKFGRFVSTKSAPTSSEITNPPDLVNVKITNPLVYIKYWWKRIMANEGIELKFKAKPVTVFGVVLIYSSIAFGLGGVVLPTFFPWVKIENQLAQVSPTPTTQIFKDTALKGTLAVTGRDNRKFYLITASTEAVTLEVPAVLNLTTLVGKRILAVGAYDFKNKTLKVEDIKNLEVLSKTPVPIPTEEATLVPTPIVTSTPEATILPTESTDVPMN